ncbi:PAS domain-containing protein [Streptomyces ficellus]|uniref:histidine kinase n=1 Tax=Streptomyces ficellus TaxID=1977088 RepID=A0A6I6FKH7_9ACTN|nr:PAS domain-containing protein [Streptomyces ficellus]QGV79715.1 PAS domain-containing protein [Streptomyces ficellus]
MSSRPSRGAARLAAILDALPDGLVLVNCNGTVVNANTIALEMFEAPGTALVGRGLLDLLPAFDSRLIPGSMRRPEAADERGRTKPARMVARRTDGSEFPVEVTSAGLEDGREAYDSYGSAYTGDELLMLVVRDLSGTIDTEAELARSQRQTEMILRAASEGVVGTDTDGRIVLVNPAAAQILGWRASDLGGKELHGLMLHSRADGEPFPFDESPLADTLRSGRKHRVRGQVVWAKDGSPVPVDLTTAPVRDGDQLVGAVMTFTDRRPYEEQETRHAAEVAALTERHTAEVAELTERHATGMADLSERLSVEIERHEERYAALAARHDQLTAVLGESLRGPLVELRRELGTLAADPAGQLWPEANQVLHHLAAGYARMTTLVDNVLGYQRLDVGQESLDKTKVLLDAVVAAGVEGAVELIGPGRVQFAVHAPPIEAEVDGVRISTALAHLIADVAGVDSTGKARLVPGGGYVDSTIVVAAAQRGDVVRIEVRGPYAGGDPVHEPIVRGIVRAHSGVLQTHEVPGMPGSAYVLEVPLGEGAGTVRPTAVDGPVDGPADGPADASVDGTADASVDGTADASAPGPVDGSVGDSVAGAPAAVVPAQASGDAPGGGRRRARRASTDAFLAPGTSPVQAEDPVAAKPTGRRRGRPSPAEIDAAAPGLPAGVPAEGAVVTAAESAQGRAALGETVPPQGVPADAVPVPAAGRRARRGDEGALPALPAAAPQTPATAAATEPAGGRRARRALGPAQDRTAQDRTAQAPEGGARTAFALPPAEADRRPDVRHDPVRTEPDADHTPSQPHPVTPAPAPTAMPTPAPAASAPAASAPAAAAVAAGPAPTGRRRAAQETTTGTGIGNGTGTGNGTGSVPLPPEVPSGDDTSGGGSTQGRAFSVRTLGQGVPFAQQIAQQQSSGSGRRRKLATPPAEGDRPAAAAPEPAARPHPQQAAPTPTPPRLSAQAEGRAYEIGAPDEDAAEGPEPLDGPGGAVEVANEPAPLPVDDELPPEPLDNPRRLLVWPAPDVSTQTALSERGYRPVIVHSREEVDAQIAAFPAALFVDPLTGPITRTALQSLRQAAVAAEVPVLLAAGLGQATREAAYGADPAVLLKALAPRDSEQHPSRVLLIEEQEEIALALTATLERRGMQVARAATDSEAVTLAAQMRPNLVVMDLMQVRRRRAGIIDWLRANGQLNRTPLVVYTSAGLQQAELPKLSSGETVLFLAERSTSAEVQSRIVDLLAKIGTN